MKNIAGKLAATAVTTGVVLGASVGMNATTVLAAETDSTPEADGANEQVQETEVQSAPETKEDAVNQVDQAEKNEAETKQDADQAKNDYDSAQKEEEKQQENVDQAKNDANQANQDAETAFDQAKTDAQEKADQAKEDLEKANQEQEKADQAEADAKKELDEKENAKNLQEKQQLHSARNSIRRL